MRRSTATTSSAAGSSRPRYPLEIRNRPPHPIRTPRGTDAPRCPRRTTLLAHVEAALVLAVTARARGASSGTVRQRDCVRSSSSRNVSLHQISSGGDARLDARRHRDRLNTGEDRAVGALLQAHVAALQRDAQQQTTRRVVYVVEDAARGACEQPGVVVHDQDVIAFGDLARTRRAGVARDHIVDRAPHRLDDATLHQAEQIVGATNPRFLIVPPIGRWRRQVPAPVSGLARISTRLGTYRHRGLFPPASRHRGGTPYI